MAYLDDNNENLYRQSDPLEELDKELAELKASLGKLEAEDADSEPAPLTGEREASRPQPPEPIRAVRADTDSGYETEDPMKQQTKKPARRAIPEKSGKNRVWLILLAVVLSVAVVIGIGWGAMRLLIPKGDTGSTVATASGEIVTINDSVMGDIDLQTVEGAEISTLTSDNLATDENGYYAYYENGKKISHLGIDLSVYQGNVDFEALKNAGVEFVMLRLGGRYYGDTGGMYEDEAFDAYYEQAKAAGLKIGAYFFSQANCTEDAVEEADFSVKKLAGRKLDYPIAFDWENIEGEEARTNNVTGDELTLIAEAFCDAIAQAGYKPIVYSNAQQMFVMYDFETMKDYDFWLADYREFPTMYYQFDMWQYAMDGTIDGVEGTVDLNLSFTDFS